MPDFETAALDLRENRGLCPFSQELILNNRF
jgi:hypothetical protein